MSKPYKIVLLFGSGFDSGQVSSVTGEKAQLESLIDAQTGPIQVAIISLGLRHQIEGISEVVELDKGALGLTDTLLAAVGAFRLRRRLALISIGRLLNNLGPVDQGRVFWRSVRRNKQAMRLLRSADIAVATDMPAVKTAWLARRRGMVSNAIYDHRAASVGASFTLPTQRDRP